EADHGARFLRATSLPPVQLESSDLMMRWLGQIARQFTLCMAATAIAVAAGSPPPIAIHQNHAPAGVLRDGVLSLQLEIGIGEWRPEAEDGIALSVYAFGEAGKPLQNPGPLIRVPLGTEIRASVRNRLDVAVSVHGLSDTGGSDRPVRIAPGKVEQVSFKASTPGLYFYWGASQDEDLTMRYGVDSQLTGALVVDPPGDLPNDEIFVMGMISEHPGPSSRKNLATINGKSWPYTQRFTYRIGQPVHWRWINATNEPHALHLHGFYYRVEAFNRDGRIETYSGDSRPMVVTQRVARGETFDMSWSPDRPGRWLFHCHMLIHMIPPVVPELPGLAVRAGVSHAEGHAAMHEAAGMGQLVLGITVPAEKTAVKTWQADRRLQLVISERTGLPRYGLQVRDPAQGADTASTAGLLGPPIVLTRGQPVEIEVVNKLKEPTAIHWHGIELESYYDGVPGWTGSDKEITPPIAPGASFEARMAPPRAGTFIYHTHWHDDLQLTNGIYGPLIVLAPGDKFDPTSDLPFVFSVGDFSSAGRLGLINGSPQAKPLPLQAGKKYRFRLINISPNNQAMQISLRGTSGPMEWTIVAKDGAVLPAEAIHSSKAQLNVTVGETYDVEFSSATAQDLVLELLMPGLKMRTSQTLSFAPAVQATGPQ